jgi:hypothetical protein
MAADKKAPTASTTTTLVEGVPVTDGTTLTVTAQEESFNSTSVPSEFLHMLG